MVEHDDRAAKELQLKLHPAMVEGDHTFGTVSDKIGDVTLKRRTPFHWFIGFAIAFVAYLAGRRLACMAAPAVPVDRTQAALD